MTMFRKALLIMVLAFGSVGVWAADTDGDGVDDINDAFPLDAYAAVDTDSDGMPDWLMGGFENFEAGLPDFQWSLQLAQVSTTQKHSGSRSLSFAAYSSASITRYTGSAISFWYRLGTNTLKLYVDGGNVLTLSNTGTSWLQAAVPVTPGLHTLKWEAHAGYIDDIDFGQTSPTLVEDGDDDNDGILDISDIFPLDGNEWLDNDKDGSGNNADPDDDNDGAADIYDAYPFDAAAINKILMRNSSTGAWRYFNMQAELVNSSYGQANVPSGADYVNQGRLDKGPLTRKLTDGQWFLSSWGLVNMPASANWQYQGKGDFDADGDDDILLRDGNDGSWVVHYVQDKTSSGSNVGGIYTHSSIVFQGAGDMNGDGRDDVLLRSSSTGLWYVYNFATSTVSNIGGMWLSSNWQFQALMDFNNDGLKDIVARQTNAAASTPGAWGVFRLNSSFNIASIYPLTSTYQNLSVIAFADSGDYDGNGTDDLLLRNTSTGQYYMFTTNAPTDANPGLQTMRGYPALYASPWQVLK